MSSFRITGASTTISRPAKSNARPISTEMVRSSTRTTFMPHTTPLPWRKRLTMRRLSFMYFCSVSKSSTVSSLP